MPTATQRIQELTQMMAMDKPKVALDTCCVQYYINNPPVQPWADLLDPIFQAGLEGKVELYVSTVVVSELLAHVYFTSRDRAGYDPELDLLAILNRHFQMLDVNGDVARAAGRLRGSHISGKKMLLKTPDALIGATSLANGHTLFVTNDAQLADALPDTNCIYLQDVALEWLEQQFSADCFEAGDLVAPSRRGPGLPGGSPLASLELASIKPDPSISWKRILADAFTVASALNEPCLLFVLSQRNARKTVTIEVLFWHEGLTDSRPSRLMLGRLLEHLAYSTRTKKAQNSRNQIYVFCFTSMSRERARQSQPCYASKTGHQRRADAWNGYLSPLWQFRDALQLPQTTWLFCQDGVPRELSKLVTADFLEKAKNVLGWKTE